MKSSMISLVFAVSVQAFITDGLATKRTTDRRLAVSSGALGALLVVSSRVNLADAIPGHRRRRSGVIHVCPEGQVGHGYHLICIAGK